MAYITYDDYATIYGTDRVSEGRFNLLRIEASRMVDDMTAGVDGVRKLKHYFPTDEDDSATVKTCLCRVVDFLWQCQSIEESGMEARGYTSDSNGIHGKSVASISAGNESISYSAGDSSNATAMDKAIADTQERRKQVQDIIRTYLNGIKDCNGVNLLYMGRYPYIRGDADV